MHGELECPVRRKFKIDFFHTTALFCSLQEVMRVCLIQSHLFDMKHKSDGKQNLELFLLYIKGLNAFW